MQQVVNDSLLKITKGGGLAFIGISIGLFFSFASRLMLARYGTEAEYGIFCLSFVILNICAVIAALGLQMGAPRSIAYAMGKGEISRVQGFISASIWLSLITGIILCLILFFTSGVVAKGVFHEPSLSFPLKIIAAAIPFVVLTNVLASIFRGFEQVKPQVYFQEILKNGLFILLLLGVILLNLSFSKVFHAYILSWVISFTALAIYTVRRLPLPLNLALRRGSAPMAKELLLFSLPLLLMAMLQIIIFQMDTVMLGYFKSSAVVGLYNAAYPLTQFVSAPLNAWWLIHLPVVSGLYAQGLLPEIKRAIVILTKWLWSATLPLFLILFLFPEVTLSFFFGASYAPAANALRILSLGFIINNLLSVAGSSLVAIGQSQFIMWSTLAAAALNIALNIILIPPLGIEGAAIASACSIICMNSIRCWRLYSLNRIQPLSKNLVKPTLVSIGLVFLVHFISANFISVTFWMLPLLFILYYAIYGLMILVTRSFDREDIALLLAIEKRVGINATLIKKVLTKFL